MDNILGYNSFDGDNYSPFMEIQETPNVNVLGPVDKIVFDDFDVEYFMYNKGKLGYLTNYIYPFWRSQFITQKMKDEQEKQNNSFNPYSTWSNSDLARHNMGLKDNTLCFQMVTCDVPIGFCSLLLLDEYDRTDRFSPFSNEIYRDGLVLYNFVIEKGFRGSGYGKKFLNIILEYIKTHYKAYKYVILYVDRDNTIARGLYEKVGFVLVGDNPNDNSQDIYKYGLL
jgi:ribosomal protein S18 acetylase RimI-like enzyme